MIARLYKVQQFMRIFSTAKITNLFGLGTSLFVQVVYNEVKFSNFYVNDLTSKPGIDNWHSRNLIQFVR